MMQNPTFYLSSSTKFWWRKFCSCGQKFRKRSLSLYSGCKRD